MYKPLGVNEILLEEVLGNQLLFHFHSVVWEECFGQLGVKLLDLLRDLVSLKTFLGLLILLANCGVVLHVRVDDEGCKGIVIFLVDVILHDGQEVESREDWVREIDVVIEVKVLIIVTFDGVRGGDDTTSGLETSNNTGL